MWRAPQCMAIAVWMVVVGMGGCAAQPVEKGHDGNDPYFRYSRLVMGAPCTLTLSADSQLHADTAVQAAFTRLAQIEEALSDWMVHSEVRQLPQRAGVKVRVGRDLWAVLVRSREIWKATEGAFDPTIGPIVLLWRNARATGVAPTDQEIASARLSVGLEHVHLSDSPPTYWADTDGIRLDFGGIGQGYGAAEALVTLREHGVTSALVDLSGDVAASGAPPGKEGWRVRIAQTGHVVLLRHAAITTSGDEFQHMDAPSAGGTTTRYSHIVDPRTGRALADSHAVTVMAPDPVVADALATAMSVLGPDAWARIQPSFPRAFATPPQELPPCSWVQDPAPGAPEPSPSGR